MEIAVIFLCGILGTTVMTTFSHLLQLVCKHRFNEAHLLNKLINRSKAVTYEIGDNNLLGWAIHFAIGILMATALFFYFQCFSSFNKICIGLILGFALGLVGIIGWKLLFNFHSNPPKIDLNYFFVQLIVAHMFFGVTATWVLSRFLM